LGGSVLPLNRMIKNFADATDAPLTEVIMAVTKTPAVELKLYDDRGSIEVGKLADFTIFDDNLNILATIAKGRTVYRNTPQERERPQTM